MECHEPLVGFDHSSKVSSEENPTAEVVTL